MIPCSRHDARLLTGLLSTLVALLLLTRPLAAQGPATVRTVTIESTELGQTREIMIFEPMNYGHDEYAIYDVLYVFDAQNRSFFDLASSIANLMEGDHRGFIVVGIRATVIEEELYGRNHDLLPSYTTQFLGPKSGGNAEAFLRYVRNEVVPLVESNYQVLPWRTAIGHSYSGSFLVWTMLEDPALFDNYVVVDPNLSHDDERLVEGLRDFDSSVVDTPSLFYMSHSRMNRESPRWREANYAANNILLEELATDDFRVVIEQYPEEGHTSSFVPSVSSALRTYVDEIRPDQVADLSNEQYTVTFRVEVLEEEDDLWIAGNQESLGGWDADRLKMERVAPRVRELTVPVRDHVVVNFFGGETGGAVWLVVGDGTPNPFVGVPRSTYPRMIRPEDGAVYEFVVYDPTQ